MVRRPKPLLYIQIHTITDEIKKRNHHILWAHRQNESKNSYQKSIQGHEFQDEDEKA